MIRIRLFFCSAPMHRLGKVRALQKFRMHYDIYNDALQCPVTHYEKCGAFLSCTWHMTTLCMGRCINMAARSYVSIMTVFCSELVAHYKTKEARHKNM